MEEKKLNFNAPLLSVRVNRKIIETPRPQRHLSVPSQKSDWELTEVAKPAAVPFVWEKTPGRPKNGSKTRSPPPEKPSITPRFPPGRTLDSIKRISGEQFVDRTVSRSQIEASPLNENLKVIEMNEDFSPQNEDDACSDAYDTLSATESFSWTCSIGGLSGYGGPYAKSSRTFTADPQTRDFMMTRFLPAARAMVIEMPQYVPRKQTAESERLIHVKKVVSGELSPLLERYLSTTASHHSQPKGNISSEDEDDEYNDCGRKSSKACDLLPQLSVRNSMPAHGMKSRAQSPISSSTPEVRRMARTAYSGPLPQTHHEKHDWNGIYSKNIQSRARSRELVENKLTGISNQFCPSRDSYIKEGLSPHRYSMGGGVSPYRNKKPRSPFHDGARFLGIPKTIKNTEADKLSSISKVSDKFQDSGSLNNLVEKTLYIDSVNNTEVSILDLDSSEAEELNKASSVTLLESRGMQEFSNPKSCTQAERLMKPKAIRSVNAGMLSSPYSSNLKGEEYGTESLNYDQDLDQEARSLQCSIVHPIENLIMKNENTKKVNDHGDSNFGSLQSPRPPPLPKSPSESWLWRTLPSISLRNPLSQVQTKKQGEEISTSSSKWETIVKTSRVRQHDHKRYSEELISHISQHSKA